MSQDPSSEIDALKKAAAGLTYPSESDEPFDVFRWDAKGPVTAKDQVAAHAGSGKIVEEVPVDTFFDQLKGSEDFDRYRQLQRALQSQLKGLKVFRVGSGEVRVDIYLIGKSRAGNWMGVHTVSVET